MSARGPAAFGAAAQRARAQAGRRVVRDAPARLAGWPLGLVLAGALLAALWVALLMAAPDRLARALAAPAPTSRPARLALVSATPDRPAPTDIPSATPPPPATATPLPIVTSTPTATPAPATPMPSDPPQRLVIPAIKLDAPVLAVGWKLTQVDGGWEVAWQVPSGAAGWHLTSALPGRPGNTVLSGHHNIEGLVFRDLHKLQAGDEVILYAGPLELHYRVTETMILQEKGASPAQRAENARWIESFPDERLTLVTCWPADNNTHRVVVVALPQPR